MTGTISYDAAGNLTTDTYSGNGSRTYDAENRMITAIDSGNQTSSYIYDAAGKRVRRSTVAQGEVWQVYGIGGELLAEYAPNAAPFLVSKEYGYRAGQLLVTASNGDDQRLQRFINQLYRGALARDADKTELNDRMNALASAGAQGQTQLLTEAKNIASELFTSQEYEDRRQTDEQYVADLYWTYFERSADVYTVAYWVGRLQSGGSDQVSREQLQTICEQWGEFSTIVSALWGANTSGENERTEHFLWNVYLGAVGAVPGSSDIQSQIDALNTASAQGKDAVISSAEQICRAMMTSSQYENRGRSDEEFVADLFEVFWQRTPDAESWSEWTQAVANDGRAAVMDAFAESKAFKEVAGALYRETLWLIPDQLGTPRMIAERTGTLAGIKRHDYLPFGEEIMAGLSGRTTQQGYVSDSVRQQFTGQERDDETGLDYFNARYHSSMQGRFTSVDPLMASAHATNPQSWNRYSYTLNNPLRYVDPTGMRVTPPSAGGTAEDVDREEYELTGGTEQQRKEKIPGKGYYITYEEKKTIKCDGDCVKNSAGETISGQGMIKLSDVVVYKDGKRAKGDVQIVEKVENQSTTIKDIEGNVIDAPQFIKDRIKEAPTEDPQPAYDKSRRPLQDAQGIPTGTKSDYQYFEKLSLTSVDKVTFTVLAGGKEVGSRSIVSTKTVNSVSIVTRPYIRK